jgi:hypothetical protein
MKTTLYILICLLAALPVMIQAQNETIDLGSLLNTTALTQTDSLTGRLSAFAHVNWSQGGIGLSYKHLVLMWNRTILPTADNYKADLSVAEAMAQGGTVDEADIWYKYDTIMVGYMFKLAKDFYPYLGTGTALRTEMVEVKNMPGSAGVITVKGKEVTFGSGIAGFVIPYGKKIILEGSVQFKPLLPFVGAGIVF